MLKKTMSSGQESVVGLRIYETTRCICGRGGDCRDIITRPWTVLSGDRLAKWVARAHDSNPVTLIIDGEEKTLRNNPRLITSFFSNLPSSGIQSPMFKGFDYKRRLKVADDGSFQLYDRIAPETNATTLFRVPIDRHVEIGSSTATVWNDDRSARMTITFPAELSARLAIGSDANPLSIETINYCEARNADDRNGAPRPGRFLYLTRGRLMLTVEARVSILFCCVGVETFDPSLWKSRTTTGFGLRCDSTYESKWCRCLSRCRKLRRIVDKRIVNALTASPRVNAA